MKFVVDTNILFSFFWRDSLTRKFLISSQFELISPEFALKEIEKYRFEIIQKARIKQREFIELLGELKRIIQFANRKEYAGFIIKAERLSPDKGDVDFLALCLKENCYLWSNDEVLKKQNKVRVLSTEDIIKILFG